MSIGLGLIGYGGMGRWHHQNLPRVGGIHVVGAYDINPERGALAESSGIRSYRTADELLGDPEIKIVTVATPNNFHKPYVLAAIAAGKHVVCEKPVAMNSLDLIDMMEAASRAGVVFSVHQNRRWDEDYRTVRKVVEAGTIGKPFYIESRVQGSRGVPGDWRCVREAGGGMILDWGVHMIDQILQMVDSPVVEVYAHLLSVRIADVDDNFKLLMKFGNGLSALVQVDTICFSNLPRWHVSGEAGTLVVDDWSVAGRIVRANTIEFRMEEGIVYTAAGPTRTMAPRPVETIEELPLPKVTSDWTEYYRNFAATVEGREELLVKPSEALRTLRVIDAAFESSSKGVCVRMDV